MPPQTVEHFQLGTGNHVLFGAAIAQRDEHIFRKCNHGSPGTDPAERRRQVAVIRRADVAALPFVGHAQQCIRVHRSKPFLPKAGDEIIH